VKVDTEGTKFVFETAPREDKVAIGVGAAGEIAATPDIAASGD
jgi:ATP-dependent Clp protease ATP-binding subunit ClpC